MKSTTLTISLPRTPDPSCPFGCDADHHGELPGELSHSVAIANIRTSGDGMLCVDLSQRDGEQPVVVLHDRDGGEVRIPEYVAVAVGKAIAVAAGTSWAAAA